MSTNVPNLNKSEGVIAKMAKNSLIYDPFVLAKTGIKYVCFTQKRVDYNMLVIVIDKYIE